MTASVVRVATEPSGIGVHIRVSGPAAPTDYPGLVADVTEAIDAVLARRETGVTVPPQRGSTGEPLVVHLASRQVFAHGDPVRLTRLEFDLLAFLCTRPGAVHDRTTLMREVWGEPHGHGSRTIDVHIRKLREKLGPGTANITTLIGVGYRFDGSGTALVA
ncbi:winged helix-turn-helix domain-containing protein [Amycolatopsis minnesotensis]